VNIPELRSLVEEQNLTFASRHQSSIKMIGLLAILLTFVCVATAEVSIWTNRADAINKEHVFNLYHDLLSTSKEDSYDGTGLKLEGLFFHNDTESLNTAMGLPHRNRTLHAEKLHSVEQFARRDIDTVFTVTCEEAVCLYPDATNTYRGFFSIKQELAIANFACGILENILPGTLGAFAVEVSNAWCGGDRFPLRLCRMIASISVERGVFRLGVGIQERCDATFAAIRSKCVNQGGYTSCTVDQTGAPFGIEFFATTDTTLTCPQAPSGPTDCQQVRTLPCSGCLIDCLTDE